METFAGDAPADAAPDPAEPDDFAAPDDYAALSRGHLSPVLGRYFERSWSHGEGHRLFDTAGRAYLDFACGIATTSLGHAHPAVTAAIHRQVDRVLHICNALGYLEAMGRLSGMIADQMPDPLDTVFFMNSGSEAIEGALKLARRVSGRPGLIAFDNAFHGRTYGAAAVTSSSLNYRVGYEPMLPSVYLTPFPNAYAYGGEAAATAHALAALRDLLATRIPPAAVAAIVIEAIQGEGGYNPAPIEFLQELRRLCDETGIMLIADEVQCGYARTGRMWGFEHAAIVPDVVCLAKAIANGLPLSALVTRRELQERWGPGAHGSTFGGNPVACAAGVAVLETIRDEGLVRNAEERGEELRAGLDEIAGEETRIGDVRGRGLMIGVEFVKDRSARLPDGATCDAILQACADRGLLVLSCGAAHQVVRFIPPLDVSSAEIQEGLEIFRAALRDVGTTSAAAGS